jgi:thiamine-monophosphate kinase
LCTLSGGDDYELVFTAPAASHRQVLAAARGTSVGVSRIGLIESEPGLRVVDAMGRPVEDGWTSFDHFS